jgi:hypothetical protein
MPNPINQTDHPTQVTQGGVHGYVGIAAAAPVAPPAFPASGDANDVMRVSGAGAPVDGTSGTGAGQTGKGSTYIDVTNANHYINAGTKASPTWKLITRAA